MASKNDPIYPIFPDDEWLWNEIDMDLDSDMDLDFVDNTDEKVLRCECGAEKCKTTHANWCPKFTK